MSSRGNVIENNNLTEIEIGLKSEGWQRFELSQVRGKEVAGRLVRDIQVGADRGSYLIYAWRSGKFLGNICEFDKITFPAEGEFDGLDADEIVIVSFATHVDGTDIDVLKRAREVAPTSLKIIDLIVVNDDLRHGSTDFVLWIDEAIHEWWLGACRQDFDPWRSVALLPDKVRDEIVLGSVRRNSKHNLFN